ncbi:hypothetical protein ACIRVK_28535 [Streptomyces sp. NPDC101152]|uniref:hypothetical protein n=1 Tax=Streptomyces sp. NPDC101152 TaxID=3366116 RepID=UPI003815691E
MESKKDTPADAARIIRRRSLVEELERSARLRAEAGIVATVGYPDESDGEVLERWSRVARR